MAHFAQLDENNIVLRVIVVSDEYEGKELEYSSETGQTWKQASYNTRQGIYYIPGTADPHPDQTKAFRKNYPGPGWKYNEQIDAFVPPQPFPSWSLNADIGQWEPPIPAPTDSIYWDWDETNQTWVPHANF